MAELGRDTGGDIKGKYDRRRGNIRRYHLYIAGGYVLTSAALFAYRFIGQISVPYEYILLFAAGTVSTSVLCLLLVEFRKRISHVFAMTITLSEFGLFLVFYPALVLMLEEMRVMALLFAFMPLTFLLASTDLRQSLVIAVGAAVIQVVASYIAIYVLRQGGSFAREVFYTAAFFPSALYISYLAGVFNGKRAETRDAKKTSERALSALWGEMELAKKIQTMLLPQNSEVAGCQVSALMVPAAEVGGDYYDIIRSGNRDWIVIGDVSGHGVPAGLVMMMAQTAIKTELSKFPLIGPAVLLEDVNHVVAENIRRMGEPRYMTVTVFSSTGGGVFRYAGLHQDIMVYRAANDWVQIVQTDGMWLGLVDDIKGMLPLGTLILAPGDVMLLFTDGIIDAVDGKGAFFGAERLRDALGSHGGGDAASVRDGILAAMQGYRARDDMTLLVIKREG